MLLRMVKARTEKPLPASKSHRISASCKRNRKTAYSFCMARFLRFKEANVNSSVPNAVCLLLAPLIAVPIQNEAAL
jgi:hypothetical protein